jgi:hypothetical protein
MKTNRTILTTALLLAVSLLAVEAQADGTIRNQYSEGSRGSTHAAKAPNTQPGKPNGSTVKPAEPKPGNHFPTDGQAPGSVACKPNPNQGPAPDRDTNCGGLNCGRGLKIECGPGTICWGRGDFRCGKSGCCVGCWPDYICFPPPYGTECDNLGGECYSFDAPSCSSIVPDVAPILVPPVKIVRMVNPVETQTTFCFIINGKTYVLEAGRTQELELTGNTVIRFDRKP